MIKQENMTKNLETIAAAHADSCAWYRTVLPQRVRPENRFVVNCKVGRDRGAALVRVGLRGQPHPSCEI
jgi:hypothetical protein